MDFGCNQPGLVANFVPDRELFISKLKKPFSPQKGKEPQKINVNQTAKINVNLTASQDACLIDLSCMVI